MIPGIIVTFGDHPVASEHKVVLLRADGSEIDLTESIVKIRRESEIDRWDEITCTFLVGAR